MDYRRHYDDERRGGRRDWSERAGDELRSWAGDDEAQARRNADERNERRGYGSDRDDWNGRSGSSFGDSRDVSRRYQAGGDYRQRADYRDDRGNEPHRYGTSGQYGGDFSGNRRDYADPSRGQRLGLDSGPDDWAQSGDNRSSRDFDRNREFGRSSGWQGYAGGSGSQGFGDSQGYGRSQGLGDSQGFGNGSQGYMGGTGSQSFAGKGPKDYKRSDERIREELSDRLTEDHMVDASEISIQVKQGDVTLTGTVTSREQKRRAEDIAERTSGVNDVTNQIRVARDDQQGLGKSGGKKNEATGNTGISGTTGTASSRPATGISS